MSRFLLLAALAVCSFPVFAVDPMHLSADVGIEGNVGSGWSGIDGQQISNASTKETIAVYGRSEFIDAVAQMSANNDGVYGSDIANFSTTKRLFNNYFYLEQGYTEFHFSPLQFQIGRYVQKDEFNSPYSLFLNSRGLSALGMRIRYEDDFFAYESKWISLNSNSNFSSVSATPPAWQYTWNGSAYVQNGTGFPDRGANLKTFLFKFGDLHLGLQDAGIYTGRSFDPEYFFSPIPEYFTQYFKTTDGRPWSTGGNENNLIGFFVTYVQPTYDWGAQVLIDDFSLHFLLPDQVPNNPWKAAWSVGGRVQTAWGRFGLYHAGALKYTFEPITTAPGQDSTSAYGYTYYPDVEYSVNGSFRTLAIVDNALGYQYGENNLAVRATYDNSIGHGLSVDTSLELVIAGNNSPANPWQDATASNNVGTHWLDDPVLQRAVVWSADLKSSYQDWDFSGGWSVGYIGNQLMTEDPAGISGTPGANGDSALDTLVKIFKPSSSGRAFANMTVGVIYHIGVSPALRSSNQ
jgi:hypothetical protein